MSEELLKTISSLATLATVLVGLYISLQNRRLAKINATKLEMVHTDVNGKMKALLVATAASERAVGEAEGRQHSLDEKAGRVAEQERVEDRIAEKLIEKI